MSERAHSVPTTHVRTYVVLAAMQAAYAREVAACRERLEGRFHLLGEYPSSRTGPRGGKCVPSLSSTHLHGSGPEGVNSFPRARPGEPAGIIIHCRRIAGANVFPNDSSRG